MTVVHFIPNSIIHVPPSSSFLNFSWWKPVFSLPSKEAEYAETVSYYNHHIREETLKLPDFLCYDVLSTYLEAEASHKKCQLRHNKRCLRV